MKFGICLPIRRDTSVDFNIELGKTAEALGFDSVWASDHVVIPDSAAGRFTEIFYDPLTTLSAIASVTREIMIGTSVIILPYRNPVVLAKSLATLDCLSGGRLVFGVAAGWLKEEFDALNVPFENRGELTDEYLEVISELWMKDRPFYRGKWFNFSDISFLPKPLQKPRPAIWIGGSSGKVLERVARYGDRWHPTWLNPDQVAGKAGRLREIAKSNGRNPREIGISVRNRIYLQGPGNYEAAKPAEHDSMFVFKGTFEEIRKQIEQYRKAGVDYLVFDPAAVNDEDNLRYTEEISANIINYFR